MDPNTPVGKRITAIEDAIDRYNLDKPTVFTRQSDTYAIVESFSDKKTYKKFLYGTSEEKESVLSNVFGSMTGSVLHDKGFTSTSTSSDRKSKMGEGGLLSEVRYRIKTPKGKGIGAYIAGASSYKDAESEFLFNRGSAFRITGVRQQRETIHTLVGTTERTIFHVDMEYVGRYK